MTLLCGRRLKYSLYKLESAQKFSKAVSFGHNQEFVQSEKDEQEIAESCCCLIKNAIICWHYLYLTQLLQQTANQEWCEEIISAIKNGSIVTGFLSKNKELTHRNLLFIKTMKKIEIWSEGNKGSTVFRYYHLERCCIRSGICRAVHRFYEYNRRNFHRL